MDKQKQNPEKITFFAVTNYHDIRKLFGIKEKNRRAHIYIIGKTGTGKSTLIENMIHSDMKDGNGIALIDPHGDLAEKVLALVPRSRIHDVIYFNPADMEYPIAFNPLERIHADYHDVVASGLIAVFKKIWSDFWGPRLEHILRYSILTLLERPDSTLLDIPRLLTDAEFRKGVLLKVAHPQVREFWFSEYDKYSAWMRSAAVSPILNKIGQFLASVPLRNIVGQRQNTFKLRTLMDEKKILIVNLAKGRIGEGNCALLGAMLVTRLQLAAMSRADVPEASRSSFYLYVDEMHNFITLSFADVLSEARKYGLSLTLVHQYIEQLDPEIRAAVFGNVGTLIAFRLGAKDARVVAHEFAPIFKENDFVNLPNYRIYLRLMIDGMTSQPFSADTLPGSSDSDSFADVIIALSRAKYSRPRRDVERDINASLQTGSRRH